MDIHTQIMNKLYQTEASQHANLHMLIVGTGPRHQYLYFPNEGQPKCVGKIS